MRISVGFSATGHLSSDWYERMDEVASLETDGVLYSVGKIGSNNLIIEAADKYGPSPTYIIGIPELYSLLEMLRQEDKLRLSPPGFSPGKI